MAHKPHWQPVGKQTGTKDDWAEDVNNEIVRITGDESDRLLNLSKEMSHANLRKLANVLDQCVRKGKP